MSIFKPDYLETLNPNHLYWVLVNDFNETVVKAATEGRTEIRLEEISQRKEYQEWFADGKTKGGWIMKDDHIAKLISDIKWHYQISRYPVDKSLPLETVIISWNPQPQQTR